MSRVHGGMQRAGRGTEEMQRNDGDKHVDPCQRSPEVDAMKKFGRSAPSPKIETATLPMLRAEQADIDAVRFPDLTDLMARLRFSTSDGCIWLDALLSG